MITCIGNISYYNDLHLNESMRCGVQRNIGEAVVLCILYLVLTVISIVSNGSVILLAIWERWRELDSFTFVFASSLSFNQLFTSFFIYPVMSYSIIARTWNLQNLWCWFCALVSSYLYTVYTLHIVILLIDMLVVKHSNTRTLISVSVSKTIALTTWVVAFAPQLYPLLSGQTVRKFRYDPVKGGCFQSFVFQSVESLFICIGIYVIIPLVVIAVRYMQLLFNEDDRRNLAATISRRLFDQPTMGIRNYSTSINLGVMAVVTTTPWFVMEILKMSSKIDDSDEKLRPLMEFFIMWMSLSSVFIPIIYLYTCPTFFCKIFPKHRFEFLYKLGLGCERKHDTSSINRTLLQNVINPIVEEGEDDVTDSEGDYIELPAVTITISKPVKEKRTSLQSSSRESLEHGITIENGSAKTSNNSQKSIGGNGSVHSNNNSITSLTVPTSTS